MMLLLAFLLSLLSTTSMILLVAVAALLVYFYRNIKEKQSVWEKKGIKYVKPKFILGNFEIMRSQSLAELSQKIYNHFPEERYHGAYQLLEPILVLKDPDLIKQIAVKEFDHFVDHRPSISADTDLFWRRNLFNVQGERWRDLRSALSPSFTSSKIKVMYNLIDECAQQFVDFFKSDSSEVNELEIRDALRRYTNDVIATTAFGLRFNSLQDRKNDFFLMGEEATDFSGLRMLKLFIFSLSPTLSKLFKVKVIPPHVADYFSQIIDNTIKTREEKNIVRPDMIHLLMEARKGRHHQEEVTKISEGFSSVEESDLLKNRKKQEISLEDIYSQAFIFFLGGFDTVSTLLTFLFYELAVNPEIQAKLRKEIEEVNQLNYESLLHLKYLDMVISEALRKWPPAFLTDRQVTKAFTIQPERPGEKPLYLEEGLICWLPIFALHRDPKLYPDPEQFDPERFSDENKHKIHPSGYISFGAGPRNCLGSRFALLTSKLVVFHILKCFEVVSIAKTQIPVILDTSQINISAKGGMWLGLKKIN